MEILILFFLIIAIGLAALFASFLLFSRRVQCKSTQSALLPAFRATIGMLPLNLRRADGSIVPRRPLGASVIPRAPKSA